MIEYFKMHKALTVMCLAMWLVGAMLGIYISAKGVGTADLEAYISDISESDVSFLKIFLNGVSASLIFSVLMILSSLFVLLIPMAFLLMAFRGFASALGSGLLIGIFSVKGAWAALGAVVLPLVFSLPIQFMIFISSMNMALRLASAGGHLAPQKELIAAQLLRMLLLFSALCAISAFEAVISPYVFLLI